MRDELAAQAIIVASDKLWIEKVKVETQPLLAASSIASRGDALADLQTLLAKAAHDEEFVAGLQKEFQQLLAKLPQPVFVQEAPALAAIKAGSYAQLVDEIAPSVIARVTQGS